MAAKKTAKDIGEVSIRVDGIADEYRYFNRFSLGVVDGMVHLKLFFLENNSDSERVMPILSAIATVDDCSGLLLNFQNYIGKIGTPEIDDAFLIKAAKCDLKPIMFHHLGVISRGAMGELIFSQFSHKTAHDASLKAGSVIEAKIFGVYTSPREVHKKIVFEFVQLIENLMRKDPSK